MAALPEWWADELWDDPASRAVGHIHLSRHLGLDIQTLMDPAATLRLKDFGVCKYKKQVGTTEDELQLARVIATRAAQLAAAATTRELVPVPSAADLRATILDAGPWVGFESLLDFCWAYGIPVVHVNKFPSEAKKPVGFALRANGRPAVVLCSANARPAWQLFVLAHELGHLHHGHVPENGSLVDELDHGNVSDPEEELADRYAIDLLNGYAAPLFTSGRWPDAARLAGMAKDYGQRNQVDPGHAVLRAGRLVGGGFWSVANAALNHLGPTPDAVATLHDRLAANLDWERLPEGDSEFLSRVTDRESLG